MNKPGVTMYENLTVEEIEELEAFLDELDTQHRIEQQEFYVDCEAKLEREEE